MKWLKNEDNHWTFVGTEKEASHVVIPVDEYHKLLGVKENHTLIPNAEYHGLLKALDIVRNKALLQVDKAKVDEHGYFLISEIRKSERFHNDVGYYYESRFRTPYSTRMPAMDVYELVKRDFEDFYDFYDFSKEHYAVLMKYQDKFYNPIEQNLYSRISLIFKKREGKPIYFEIGPLYGNYGLGVYEVGIYRNLDKS